MTAADSVTYFYVTIDPIVVVAAFAPYVVVIYVSTAVVCSADAVIDVGAVADVVR